MSLKARITEDMKSAMRAGEKDRLSCIRMLQAGIKQREVDERIELDDAQVLAVIDKMIKQRRESVAQFQAGNRADLVAKETAEIDLLSGYLPAQLGDTELADPHQGRDNRNRGILDEGHGQGHGHPEAEGPGPRRHGRTVGSHQGRSRRLNE